MRVSSSDKRPWTFYALAAFFALYIAFVYGPMAVIYVLSFQGPDGGMTFPLRGLSTHWFYALLSGGSRNVDIPGAFQRSIILAVVVGALTVAIYVPAGLGFRRRFRGSGFVFYMAIASLVLSGLFVGLGVVAPLGISLIDKPPRGEGESR